jgi:uncharacterized protein (DUF885 family)
VPKIRSIAIAALLAIACSPAASPPSSPTTKSSASSTAQTPDAGAPAAKDETDDAAVAKAGQEFLDLFVEIMPEQATALGLHKNDALLEDRTIAGHDKNVDREEAMAKALRERFKSPKLSPSARTDLALLLGALETDVRKKRVQRPLQRQPGVYTEPLEAIFQMTARDYAPAADRARNVVARLERIPKTVEAAKENLLNPPRVWTEVAIDRASSARSFLEAQRKFLVDSLPQEIARVEAALKAAETAYDDYKTYLQKTILPKSNGRFSAGKELFEFLLKNHYFVEESADELDAMGKKTVAEINAEMDKVAKRIDPKAKGWPEVAKRVKGKHPGADEVLDAYKKEVARARKFIVDKDVVDLPPGDDLDVIDTPPFMRSTVTAAYDAPPPFDPNVSKGFFFVTPIDKTLPKGKQEEMLRENDWADVVDTTVHEAYPGHHLQLSFARRNPSLIRKALDAAIFSEGWALYSEELMAELGYYDDEQRLIQLEWALVRAARIVLDVGLHVKDMTFDQAVKMLTDEVHLERTLALSEVKRYTLNPTQPLAYMVGRQLIFRLRDDVKKRDGAKFSLKKFHADLLSRGTVPPPLLAKEIFADR